MWRRCRRAAADGHAERNGDRRGATSDRNRAAAASHGDDGGPYRERDGVRDARDAAGQSDRTRADAVRNADGEPVSEHVARPHGDAATAADHLLRRRAFR